MQKKGVDLDMQCRIYEVCNPRQAKRVLEEDGAISTALPCRISVYGNQGDFTIATMLPTEMMKAFNRPGIEPVAKEVEQVIVEMMDDAAGQVRLDFLHRRIEIREPVVRLHVFAKIVQQVDEVERGNRHVSAFRHVASHLQLLQEVGMRRHVRRKLRCVRARA